MNAFLLLEKAVRAALAARLDIVITVDRPVNPSGVWIMSIVVKDGYVIEIEWNRHRGFGLTAGWDLDFGAGVDEIVGSEQATVARILALIASPVATCVNTPVDLAALRKSRGALQKDLAFKLGITKSGLAQLEKPEAFRSMQLGTLRRIVAELGGELVITAKFPAGRQRRIDA